MHGEGERRDIVIRPATQDDAQALHDLNQAFNGEDTASLERVRRALAAHPEGEVVFLALLSGMPAGFVCGQVLRSFCYDAPQGLVTELYVDPTHRRLGIAAALLRAVEQRFSSLGVRSVSLETGLKNHAAQAVYLRCGYTPKDERVYQKALGSV